MTAPAKNLILLSVDDMLNVVRYRDAFGITLQTPALDRLMEMGTTFENTFAASPLCGPSRAATLTGQSPYATGVLHNAGMQIADAVTADGTLFGAMHAAGYLVALRGKQFHGQSDSFVRDFLGDTVDIYGGSDGYTGAGNILPGPFGAAPVPEGEMADAITAAWAADLIAAHDGTAPLFLAAGIIRPHLSWDVPATWYGLYDPADVVVPEIDGQTYADLPAFFQNFLGHGPENHEAVIDAGLWREMVHAYAAAISFADAQIGKVLDAIDAAGLWESSTVVLWSDHGYHLGDRDVWKKFTLWEEAASVPFIVADPGVARGATVSTPASLLDLWPTIAGLTGVSGPAAPDGIDLFGTEARAGVLTVAYGSISIRTDDWRFTLYQDGAEELFKLGDGQTYARDVSGHTTKAGILADIRALLVSEALAQFGVQVATRTDRATSGDDIVTVIGAADVTGGDGDDLFFVTDGGTVTEWRDKGHDTAMLATADRVKLFDNVEDGELIAKATGDLVGNRLDNLLTGNAKANRLMGRNGDDVLDGGGGKDRLKGDAGADTFVFATGYGNDKIVDFEVGTDTLTLDPAEIENITQHGDRVLIDLGDGDALTILGVSVDDLVFG